MPHMAGPFRCFPLFTLSGSHAPTAEQLALEVMMIAWAVSSTAERAGTSLSNADDDTRHISTTNCAGAAHLDSRRLDRLERATWPDPRLAHLAYSCRDLRVSSQSRPLASVAAKADAPLVRRVIPVLAAKLGAVSFLLSLPRLPREIAFATVDGFSRIMGITTLGVDVVLQHPNAALRTSPWAMIVVATIAGGGGGMIVPAFKGFGPNWGFTDTPSWIKDGPSVDIWGATVVGYVYA